MTHRSLALFLGICLLLGLAAFLVGTRSTSDTAPISTKAATSDAAPVVAASGLAQPGIDRAAARSASGRPSVAAILAGRTNFAEGFTDALAMFGPRNAELISAVNEAMEVCSVLPTEATLKDPRSGLVPGMKDPQRIWAVEKLQLWCEGFDGPALLAQLDNYDHLARDKALQSSRSGEPIELANTVVGSSRNRRELLLAGIVLLRNDRLPLHEIFGAAPPVGRAQLFTDWIHATSLATCDTQLGCGPESPNTMLLCAQLGCVQGMSYEQAIAAAFPPRDYQAMLAFRRWIRSRQR